MRITAAVRTGPLVALLLLAGCTEPAPAPDSASRIFGSRAGPADAPPGTCWARQVTPALVETVTEQVRLRPGRRDAQGQVQETAQFRTETRQRILRDRETRWFETPCPDLATPDFIASLQRALAVRGYLDTTATGRMNTATAAAIRRFQRDTGGPDSGALSLETARALGLVAVARDTPE
ncbi:MAG: peptidoglycan-binding domain-containing protein [Paracoccaceae bacterium]